MQRKRRNIEDNVRIPVQKEKKRKPKTEKSLEKKVPETNQKKKKEKP